MKMTMLYAVAIYREKPIDVHVSHTTLSWWDKTPMIYPLRYGFEYEVMMNNHELWRITVECIH